MTSCVRKSRMPKPTAPPAETMVVGIDGCFIKGIRKARKSSIEVVLGRVESRGRPSEVSAVVRKLGDLAKERVRRSHDRDPERARSGSLSDALCGNRTRPLNSKESSVNAKL